ncbi:MAG: TonB-dependent receptor, partial [Acidobacteria bacterium]|nr:TonB-dependent receptor [Acidobacteriota bacterium]
MILKKYLLGVAALILLLFSAQAFSQSNASIGGTVMDESEGVLPGATVTVTNVATGISREVFTDESGVFNIVGLQVGNYTVTAELDGFQKKTLTGVRLVPNDQIKVNLKLPVGVIEEEILVSVETESVLLESSPSVGMVLPETQVSDLPLVNSNALDLIKVMGGVNITPNAIWAADQTTLAGVGADQVNVQRDGVTVNDVRWAVGMSSPVHLNPEIVGEIKLVVAPVDAEMGRGSGQVQVVTKSGNNEYTGSAVWNIQNTALDANWWTNGWQETIPPWRNQNELTFSFGGPIIKNKTFFFASWNQQIQRVKENNVNRAAPTAWAKLGIMRWFEGYNGQNLSVDENEAGSSRNSNPSSVWTVNADGSPRMNTSEQLLDSTGGVRLVPEWTVAGSDPVEYIFQNHGEPSQLHYQYAFAPFWTDEGGNLLHELPMDSNGNPAFSATDFNPDGSLTDYWVDWYNPYDAGERDSFDQSGFVQRFLADMYPPEINNWDVGDGLNYGGFRWTRVRAGYDNIYGLGESPERKQITARLDHNFNPNHRLSGSFSYERSKGMDQGPSLPENAYPSFITRYPSQLSASLTSTLRPTLLNELRFGFNKQTSYVNSPLSTPGTGEILTSKMLAKPCEGDDCVNYFREDLAEYPEDLPLLIGLDGGFQIAGGYHPYGNGRGNHGTQWGGDDYRFVYADTVTWTKGRHTVRFGGEIHRTRSWQLVNGTISFGASGMTYPGLQGGDASGAPNESLYTSGGTYTPEADTYFTDITGTGGGGSLSYVYDVMNLLAGSIGTARQYRFINDPTATEYNDIRLGEDSRITDFRQNQFNFFVQDEWRVTDSLSLTLGLRYEQYGVPYLKGGMTIGLADGANSIFGVSGNSFADWFVIPDFEPCEGCNEFGGTYAGELSTLAFIGPDSPNPDQQIYGDDWNNFGPAVGFSWQLPWFGKGKTMLRGGYQMTYATPGRAAGNINYAPGIFQDLSYTGDGFEGEKGGYMDLTMVDDILENLFVVPSHLVPPAANPTIPIYQREQGITVYDPNLRNPYIQRLTLALVRNIGSNMTLELKYVGNLSRKQVSGVNVNSANFINNGLFNVLEEARRGENPALLDQMLYGTTLLSYLPAVGSGSTGGQQLRAYSGTAGNLANGNFAGVAGTLGRLNYNRNYGPNAGLPEIPNYTNGAILRLNGFPENYIFTNPQFSGANIQVNQGRANYHSMQAQFTMRATRGLYFSGTWTWSRNLSYLSNPDVRYPNNPLDYGVTGTHRSHTLRTNGTYELPFG